MSSSTTSNDTSSNNEVLYHFKNAGQSVELITFGGIKFIFAILAQLSFRDSYNILIAANCFCGFFYMFTFSIQFVIAVTGINFIPLKICFPLMALPFFSVQAQYLFYLALSIDRLLAVVFPIWHITNIQKSDRGFRIYLTTIIASILFYATFTVTTGINLSFYQSPEKLVTCATQDPIPSFYFNIPLYINFLSLLFYILLWVVVHKKGITLSKTNNTRRMLKSILFVFFLEFFGWFGNALLRNVLTWLAVPELKLWFFMQIAGLFLVPALALYAPVIYKTSSIYGSAYYKCFGHRFPFSEENASSTVIQNKQAIVQISHRVQQTTQLNRNVYLGDK
uniref:G-protein coupled receptors family 1 profile domain-containing protein n=1 Tax=Meloidogyne floridensis TaxID=298350 RepID=A0A915P9R2_9BILA